MSKQLAARKQQSEDSFNKLQAFKSEVLEKLKAFGLGSFTEIEEELLRLQGEYRLIEELLDKPSAKPSKVSPTPEVIDATEALENDK